MIQVVKFLVVAIRLIESLLEIIAQRQEQEHAEKLRLAIEQLRLAKDTEEKQRAAQAIRESFR